MINLSNNFNVVEKLIDKCEINIVILSKEKANCSFNNKDYSIYNYIINATIRDSLTNNTLLVEKLSFSRDETVQNSSEDELIVKRIGMKFNFSMEEHVVMAVVSDAGFYQKYNNDCKATRKIIKDCIQPNNMFIELHKMKTYYDFILNVVSLQ